MVPRDVVELVTNWPQPNAGSPEPRIVSTERGLIVSYETNAEAFAVVVFPICHLFQFGHPNDEVLSSHPLFGRGLKFYSVHRVVNSSRLAMLEKANSVHPGHVAATYLNNKEHFIFTFHDSTLECLVTTNGRGQPHVSSYSTREAANAAAGLTGP